MQELIDEYKAGERQNYIEWNDDVRDDDVDM